MLSRQSSRGMGRAGVAMALVFVCALLPGCVAERVEPGRTALGAPSRSGPSIGRSGAEPIALPGGPVAAPASSATTVQTAVRVAVQPIGLIDFDGQVLPRISPNGRYVAVQVGEAPDWPTMLGDAGASVPRTRIVAHRVSDDGAQSLPVAWATDTRGLLLGRSADARGVLVEAARSDGSRWIGVLLWASGEVDWLVTTQHVNAHAVLIGGTLAWSQREIGQDRWSVRVRDLGTGAESALQSSASLIFPLITPDEKSVLAIAVGEDRLRAQSYAIERSPRGMRLGGLRARVDLGPAGDGLLRGYQAMQPTQALQPALAHGTSDSVVGLPGQLLLLFHPGLSCMVVLDAERGELTTLASQSIAGAWNHRDGLLVGVFLTTPRGLEHQPLLPATRGRRLGEAGPSSRVLGEPYVPRLTSDPARPFILLGPAPRQPRRMALLGMSTVPDAKQR